jgi:hypothetical protein
MDNNWYRNRAAEILRARPAIAEPVEGGEVIVPTDAGPPVAGTYMDTQSAEVSKGENPGAWVQFWVFVPDSKE